MLNFISSLRLFFSLCLALAGIFIYQTIFNRGTPVYGSAWFAALGVLVAVNLAACALRRAKTASAPFLFLHAGLVVIILGAFATRFYRFEAQLPLHAGQASSLAYNNSGSYELPFSVKLENLRLEYYAEPLGLLTVEEDGGSKIFAAKEGAVIRAAGGEIRVLRLFRDFGLNAKNEVVEKSPYWHNPAARLEISAGGKKKKLWFFGNFPGRHGQDLPFKVHYGLERAEIKNFTSAVTVSSGTGTGLRGEIAVNRPLKVGAYSLYQTSYDPADAGYSLLTVTLDRGRWAVYAGFIILLTGVLLWLRR